MLWLNASSPGAEWRVRGRRVQSLKGLESIFRFTQHRACGSVLGYIIPRLTALHFPRVNSTSEYQISFSRCDLDLHAAILYRHLARGRGL